MKLQIEFVRTVEKLQKFSGYWAVCGGIAASIYSDNPRFTNDLDLILIDSPELSAEEIARQVILELDQKEIIGYVPDFRNPEQTVQGLICYRENLDRFKGVDFLLPVLEWVQFSVLNAQKNLIDYGFGKLPTIIPEDLIFAKLLANREQDRLDVKNIINSKVIELDLEYINKKIADFDLKINLEDFQKKTKWNI